MAEVDCGLTRSVFLPPGTLKDVAQAPAPGFCFRDILHDVRPFVKGDDDRVVGFDILRQPVGGAFKLDLEGPKESVPNDKDPRIVSVEVKRIRPVMHPVMRGGVKDPFERS